MEKADKAREANRRHRERVKLALQKSKGADPEATNNALKMLVEMLKEIDEKIDLLIESENETDTDTETESEDETQSEDDKPKKKPKPKAKKADDIPRSRRDMMLDAENEAKKDLQQNIRSFQFF